MAILAINCGSSSLKASCFFDGKRLDVHFKALNSQTPLCIFGEERIEFSHALSITQAVNFILEHLKTKNISIQAIGHRFVHGASLYTHTVEIDESVITGLETLIELAPLHNSACLEAIKATTRYTEKSIPQFAIFDTAFHSQMPEVASLYALPRALAEKLNIKRYGFHGISHGYLWDRFTKYKKSTKKIITCHLGAGASIAAINEGKCIDTSMGLTPCEGLVMATRSGDVDPCLLPFLCKNGRMSLEEASDILNFKSGLLGLSQCSSDMQHLLALYKTDCNAALAVDLFCYRVQKYLGAYLMVQGGVDAILFSGGIGENSPEIRKIIVEKMAWLNVVLDEEKNQHAMLLPQGSLQSISSETSSIEVAVIATDENAYINKEVQRLLKEPLIKSVLPSSRAFGPN